MQRDMLLLAAARPLLLLLLLQGLLLSAVGVLHCKGSRCHNTHTQGKVVAASHLVDLTVGISLL
jgi:hypothetical protein